MGPRRARRRGMVMGAAIASSKNKSAAPAAPAAAQPAPASTDDVMAQIEKMSELKEKGILTQEEFDAKKKQLLGL